MARFLTTTDTSAAIERVIREAEQELTLISAYVYPRVIHLDRLRDAGERGVRIRLIFGKRDMDGGVFKALRELPNLELYYLSELHAKCYFNEREAVITSLNLLNSSEANNREMGVSLDRERDLQTYQDALREAASILRAAKCIHRGPTTSVIQSLPEERIADWKRRVARLNKQPASLVMDARLLQIRKARPRAYFLWTPEEEQLLAEMREASLPVEMIGQLLQRQTSAVSQRERNPSV